MEPSLLAGKLILVVDDDEDIRDALIFDLKRRGCFVFEASDGMTALQIARSNKIDMIISDVRMPNGDGIFLLKEIRKNLGSTPILFLATGFADLLEAEALKMGAFALLDKPIDRKKLFALLEKALHLFESKIEF